MVVDVDQDDVGDGEVELLVAKIGQVLGVAHEVGLAVRGQGGQLLVKSGDNGHPDTVQVAVLRVKDLAVDSLEVLEHATGLDERTGPAGAPVEHRSQTLPPAASGADQQE